jgi:ABC-type lipopolysaccharide export system ATPase subunit
MESSRKQVQRLRREMGIETIWRRDGIQQSGKNFRRYCLASAQTGSAFAVPRAIKLADGPSTTLLHSPVAQVNPILTMQN